MHRARHLPLTSLLALVMGAGALVPGGASAAWPPPPTATAADMATPQHWPNDPAYAYSSESDGQWNYYSFVPDPSGFITPRPEETASGMSIDLAWRLTTGDPRVRIAITDSGIHWDEPDLVEQVWLNHRELTSHKPRTANDDPCGGEGELAGFDCNGDGKLTVADYRDTPSLQPPPSSTSVRGDLNGNGHLDAGDLILNFSDGIDDDQNGYIDDIAGWDFFKDDNDPHDDTRYGHGTGQARDSVAQANNGIGGAGACPDCRFIPLRVGDSFIADASDFAQALAYAADNGASVVQCALGTIDNTRFTQAALDYAYKNGVLVITSMADESSRHHNHPATSNHTLPVHAIRYDGASATASSTYLDFHPCSNYGGQNFLSASGKGCSSEATGQLSGIAGLLYAASLKYSVPLSPGEAQSLLFMTADDIDKPESREQGSPYAWSQRGFDQRFGYGRVNANRAVEAIRDRRIPPAVDITSPLWFQVLYEDRVSGPIPIQGTVSARRATAYDYVVEWAPGVQPFDDAFTVLAQANNIPSTIVSGEQGPLANLELRSVQFSPEQARDPDSPRGENDRAITVRVRSVAHYGGDIGDVPGELRRTYYIHRDPTLLRGFPIHLGGSDTGSDSGEGSPKMADVDGDGIRDLVFPTAGGEVHVLRITPTGPIPLAGFPFRTAIIDGLADPASQPARPSYLTAPAYKSGDLRPDLAREAIVSSPAVDDLDGDGHVEIVVSTWPGTLYVIGHDGQPKPGWPRRLPDIPSCPLDPAAPVVTPCMSPEARITRGTFASPVLVDLDGDGALDIVQAAFDGQIHAFDAAGNDLPGFPVALHYTGPLADEPARSRILTTPAVGDFNDDGIPDLLVGSSEQLGDDGNAGAVYLVDGRGNEAPDGPILPGWPVTMTSFELFPLIGEGIPNAGAIARFDDTLATITHGQGASPLVLPARPGDQRTLTDLPANALPVQPDGTRGLALGSDFGPASTAHRPNSFLPLFAQPSVGDLDQDGVPDIVTSGGSLALAGLLQGGARIPGDHHLLAMWSGKTGAMLPGSPVVLEDYTFFNNQAIADLNDDGYPEVLTGTGGYFLRAVDACGREATGFPKFTGQWIISTPALGDLDGDGFLDVAVGTRDGWLYAWHTDAPTDTRIEWESFHHDNRNTGNLETPLTQGSSRMAATPLTPEMCAPPPTAAPPSLRPIGGCTCTAPGHDPAADSARHGSALLLPLAALTALAARRRQRRSSFRS
ncbi:S8 family serine peptidase [Chondromyces crocatus]|uniref:Alkaline serine protease n=1 Tax=Chondromyces crocatus TaxID=52 RepID=A0A0K1EDT6_CHOCO|nr:FG-GAP-like repeat-containing protein [Chondromyces crocatus]AKT38733.1 alkaline serine protease [Chondromyces crocatus]